MEELKEYRPKESIKAFVYNGTEKMALQIDNSCYHSYAEYDEFTMFIGLYAYTYDGLRMRTPALVNDGDYLRVFNGFYVLESKKEFEEKYVEI